LARGGLQEPGGKPESVRLAVRSLAVTIIVAHRGYSAAFRENSAPSWRGAVAAGADVVEVDIRMSADGAFVCAHDPDLRLAGHPGVIADMPAEAIAALAAGGEPAAPRLETAFAAVPATTPLLFDVKDERPEVLAALHGLRMAFPDHRVIFGLHALASVRIVRALGQAEILGLLGGAEAEDEAFFALGGTVLRLWEAAATPARIEGLVERGRPVWLTTGGPGTDRPVGDFDPVALRAAHRAGIAGFLVNDPVAARQALDG
jgi:glycerophosphoryl diester phosphodiesterase